MSDGVGVPIIYEENRIKVIDALKNGWIDYLDLADWTFQDRFFAFLLGIRFFEICGASYPSPREKEEVALWFLLACKVQMKLHTTAAFDELPGILRSGAVLSRVKFNVGGNNGGFNNKNKKERSSPVHHDTARKFYKDTDPMQMRHWHNTEVQRFIRHNRGFDKHGIFLLDQTHLVVPDNANYKDAVRMPVDEHGQLIDMSGMTAEQKKAIKYHPCYALSELLHIGKEEPSFIFAGYQLGPGNVDELEQGMPIEERHRQIKNFWRINKFTSPDRSLVEAHVLFTLLTYSLVQLYLNKNHLTAIANKTIQSLRSEEQIGINSVIVYSGAYFAVFDLDDYTEIIIDLNEEARSRLQKWIKVFKERDKFKGS
ncbi:MAG: hypothetical protein HY754_15705 [Nitrospirae bacterium]|nr:hypothetical protein [Nitrospirota bacterium]